MRLFRKFKEEGLSLRLTFLLMLFISLAITASLLFTNFRTIKSFHALDEAMDTYIDLQDAADSLLRASDYLTEQAQRYTVIGDRKLLDNYFNETENVPAADVDVAVTRRTCASPASFAATLKLNVVGAAPPVNSCALSFAVPSLTRSDAGHANT